MKRQLIAVMLVAGISVAEAAAPAAPGAGTILQQVQPPSPLPVPPTGTPLRIEKGTEGQLPASAPFKVTSLQISGNTLFDTATLHALVVEAEGRNHTLAQLADWVTRITIHYRTHGYPLAQAIIPAQTIVAGVVAIEVIEARYGQVSIDNGSRVNDARVASIASLQSGDFIAQNKLDRALLLLSDTPGISVNALLTAGETVGTSDLQVEAMSGSAVAGNFLADGYGNAYTGRQRIGGTLELVNPLQLGDLLTISGVTSGERMNYGRAAYETLLNGHGTRMGAAYSALHYEIGGSLAGLDAQGTARTQAVWTKQTLLRSQAVNLYAHVQYNWLQLRDRIDAASIRTHRNIGNWTASVTGDARDTWMSGGINAWSLSGSSGQVEFDNAAARLSDASAARTQGDYLKWNATLVRMQRIAPQSTLHLSFSGQWANDNLDSSEKMLAGGPYSVRAYDIGAASGDTGYLGTVEFRQEMGLLWGAPWQMVAFLDRAQVTFNKIAFAPGSNRVALSGAGLGINRAGTGHWSTRAHVALPVGETPELTDNASSARLWVEVSRLF